jgi:putative spermidine/putrescine transport system ATP-binding protein
VLLLDEPLSALDAKIRVALRAEIRAIQRKLGITTVYVTHDQEEALSLSDRVVVMSEGRIEQIGTPFEVYNFPATAFVASFVGTLNSMTATVVDPGAARVSVGGQEIRVSRPLDERAGATITFALRPELVSLDGAAQGNRLQGVLEDITFLGSIVRMRVRVGDEAVHLDTFNNPHLSLPAQGSSIALSFPVEACLVLAGAPAEVEEELPEP